MRTVDELEDALRTGSTDHPLGGPDLDRIRSEGRRRQVVRRAGATAAGLAVAATVTGIALVVPALVDDGADDGSTPVASVPPRSDEELIERCRDGSSSARIDELLFGSGTPTIKAEGRTSHRISLALESADGAIWGHCFVALDDQEFSSGLEVYRTEGSNSSSTMSYGPGCGLDGDSVDTSCTTVSVMQVERRPAEVAAVRFLTADGETTTVRTRDGYYVFEYLGDLPEGTRMTQGGLPRGFYPVRTITFLDASGTPIAAEAQDGSGEGVDRNRIGDLPLLSSYPAQGGDEIY